MTKNNCIYEFCYIPRCTSFESVCELRIERETSNMYYGDAYRVSNRGVLMYSYGKFAINKNKINTIKINKAGVFVVRVLSDSYNDALVVSFNLLQEYLASWMDDFYETSIEGLAE